MINVENAVRKNLCRVLDYPPQRAAELDLDQDLFDEFGLTSVNMVVLMTSLCDDTRTELTRFTDKDIAGFRTPRHIVAAIERFGNGRS